MFIPCRTNKCDIGSQSKIVRVGDFLPDKMKIVLTEPHVVAAAAHRIGLVRRVVLHRSRMEDVPDVLVPLKNAERGRSRCRGGGAECQQSQHTATGNAEAEIGRHIHSLSREHDILPTVSNVWERYHPSLANRAGPGQRRTSLGRCC